MPSLVYFDQRMAKYTTAKHLFAGQNTQQLNDHSMSCTACGRRMLRRSNTTTLLIKCLVIERRKKCVTQKSVGRTVLPSDLIIEETTKNTQLLNWENIKLEILGVVYFDQLLGAARTQNLVKILFFAVFNLFCLFSNFCQ